MERRCYHRLFLMLLSGFSVDVLRKVENRFGIARAMIVGWAFPCFSSWWLDGAIILEIALRRQIHAPQKFCELRI